MFGIPFYLLSDQEREWRRQRHERMLERRLPLCKPWDQITRFEKELNVKASTFTPLNLFPELAVSDEENPHVILKNKKARALSPSKTWMYCLKRVPKGYMLDLAIGGKSGNVIFDDDIAVPCVHEMAQHSNAPWMSITPQELLSLRPGTRRAKGSVIIAGLGLGHQLIEVSKRKQVTKLTLVERSQELVDWLLPRILPHVDKRFRNNLKVVVDDAYKAVPKMKADVALIDIFSSYGWNDFNRAGPCPNIKTIWCWGSAASGR